MSTRFEAVGAALNRNKRLIAFSTLGPAVAALAFCALVNPRYTADTRLQALDAETVNGQMQLLTSRDLAHKAVQALDLQNNPEFAGGPGVLAPLVWIGACPIRRFRRRKSGRSPVSSTISRSRRRPGRAS